MERTIGTENWKRQLKKTIGKDNRFTPMKMMRTLELRTLGIGLSGTME